MNNYHWCVVVIGIGMLVDFHFYSSNHHFSSLKGNILIVSDQFITETRTPNTPIAWLKRLVFTTRSKRLGKFPNEMWFGASPKLSQLKDPPPPPPTHTHQGWSRNVFNQKPNFFLVWKKQPNRWIFFWTGQLTIQTNSDCQKSRCLFKRHYLGLKKPTYGFPYGKSLPKIFGGSAAKKISFNSFLKQC